MKILCRLLVLALLLAAFKASPQTPKFIHSHNDYNNLTPFYKAFYNGFNCIEADVFCVNGKLLVAHDSTKLSPYRTLKELYLDPIIYALSHDGSRQLCLLIDVKKDHQKVLDVLVQELKPLENHLLSKDHPGRLKILISGERPLPSEYKNYPGYLFFDDNLVNPHTKAEWDWVGMVSLDFSSYSKWNGTGEILKTDREKIKYTIDSVHTNTRKPVRFWGAPDSPASWALQIDLGTDVIGTDLIDQLPAYLAKRSLLKPASVIIN